MSPREKISALPEMQVPYTVDQLKAAGQPWKDKLTFGQRLRMARREAGLSIEDAAYIFRRSARQWKYWEADQRTPPTESQVITQEKLFSGIAKAGVIFKKARQNTPALPQ